MSKYYKKLNKTKNNSHIWIKKFLLNNLKINNGFYLLI